MPKTPKMTVTKKQASQVRVRRRFKFSPSSEEQAEDKARSVARKAAFDFLSCFIEDADNTTIDRLEAARILVGGAY